MRRTVSAALLAFSVALLGCGSSGDEDDAPPPPPAGAVTPAPQPVPPAGAVPVRVQTVQRSVLRGGYTLLLRHDATNRTLPILIGDAEGAVIERRLAGQRFDRPLTHDLLDNLVRTLGGQVVQVEIHSLQNNVFIGYVHVWDGQRVHEIDSRSSDAVAIAVGNHVPIYVSEQVLNQAAVNSYR
ncbi:MAG TPA: bifunctional nuclease family protein [Sandaracinaceae bacterium LLY-WYZ-13_1]|nr:bifunctional nuclease family protein [Sandaracinaceae bacterium LLY-WYZ-13_1]